MGGAIRCAGAAILLLCAVFLIRAYKGFLSRRRAECDELLLIMRGVRHEVEHFLTPMAKIFERFAKGASVPSKIAKSISRGTSAEDAYTENEGELAVGEVGKEILDELFSGLGKGYKEGAVSHIASCERRFDEYTERIKDEDEKNVRLATALIFGGALGIVLLLI